MEKRTEKSNSKKRVVIAAVFCVILIGICIILACVNKNMCDEVRSTLVGKTFSGVFTYYGNDRYLGKYTIKNTYTIEFIDESKCNITIHYTTDGVDGKTDIYLYKDRNETETYTEVTYSISGGLSGATITWSFDEASFTGFYQEPFAVDTNGETITMYCQDFLYGTSLLLTEK